MCLKGNDTNIPHVAILTWLHVGWEKAVKVIWVGALKLSPPMILSNCLFCHLGTLTRLFHQLLVSSICISPLVHLSCTLYTIILVFFSNKFKNITGKSGFNSNLEKYRKTDY